MRSDFVTAVVFGIGALGSALVSLGEASLNPQAEIARQVLSGSTTDEDRPLERGDRITLVNFDGAVVPRNKAGDEYPTYYYRGGKGSGGKFSAKLNAKDRISGKSLELSLTEGCLYAQFNPYGTSTRGFARDYCVDPSKWKFNTYNRMRFWIKAPPTAPVHKTTGQANYEFGLYCKRVDKADRYSDEAGGGHFYHLLNVPATGQWTQVILNMHPSHIRGSAGGKEQGNMPHPTGEERFNYFDTLTRFYIECTAPPSKYPAVYGLDEFEFYRQAEDENDAQVYSITGTSIPQTNRIILTWSRIKDENTVKHEVRYAFEDIHAIGWSKAKPAPQGVLKPPGEQGYNGMVYDTSALPLRGRDRVYLAIKPENAELFSQIAVPLGQP